MPRFNVKLPSADLTLLNTTAVLIPDTVNEMTNVAFIGTRLNWKVQKFKKYGVDLAQNIIAYWCPETAHIAISTPTATEVDANGVALPTFVPKTESSRNFLGTELTLEASALFYERFKVAGYLGVLLPGSHYKDMAGTYIKKFEGKTGSDLAYIGNISAAYFF